MLRVASKSDIPDDMRGRRAQAEHTRTRILDAAEERFARTGVDRTRLEDVAKDVGIRRGAIFHYFSSKQELYEAMLSRIGENLMSRLRMALVGRETLPDRMEAALLTWINFTAERPAFPRLILRLAADASDADRPAVERFASPFMTLLEETLERGEREGLLEPIIKDPLQLAATIAGSTVFFLATMPAVVPANEKFDPLSPKRLEAHRRDALLIAQLLAGISPSDQGKRAGKPTRLAREA